MLSPLDDYPIHPSADPIVHPATGDPNHYDRYWFNGHQKDGAFYFGAAMGHYPVRGVIDAAFSLVRDGVEHSIFASGMMPSTIHTGLTAAFTASSKPVGSRSNSMISIRSTGRRCTCRTWSGPGWATGSASVLEQAHFGLHAPTGLTGLTDGYAVH
jgi:hypothetical protein